MLILNSGKIEMIIRHNLPNNKYTKLDRQVFVNKNLTDGAVRLYGYLCGLRNGSNFSDKYITKAMAISQRALANRKKELREASLILVEQISPRIYILYIGHSSMPAAMVKASWQNDEDKID